MSMTRWCSSRSSTVFRRSSARVLPQKGPATLRGENGYDYRKCREDLRWRIKVRIARKGVESRERLGRYRWVVERTLAWLNCFRRLRVREERRAAIHEAFLYLGCALICLNDLPERF